jgi:3-hydroxyisobutyrate dehydrogenase-like beta-hydroxyacid dehydrogenase
VTRLGLLFPGEMGTDMGRATRGEVLWASEGRSEATTRRATTAGFRDVGTVAALVEASEIVLSVCPPAVAEQVAEQVAELGFRGLYVEANAISPLRAERIALLLAGLGAQMVDGAIIGRTGLHLYLSGGEQAVAKTAELFAGSNVSAIPLAGEVGAASALKMAFGGWNKAGVALAAQAYAIARAYGVEHALSQEGVEGERIVRAGPKAWRWSPEMEEVAQTCGSLGVPEEMAHGAAELFARWAAHRDQPAELERLLDDLTDSNTIVR